MDKRRYIRVNKTAIPYRAVIEFPDTDYIMVFYYNSIGDFFTIDLIGHKGVSIYGEKITYGYPLFQTARLQAPQVPSSLYIIPYDIGHKSTRVGWDDLGENVFLYVMTPEEYEKGEF